VSTTLKAPALRQLLLLALLSPLLLIGCTPTATGPSAALKQQFAQMQRQQRQQAEQIRALQEQLAQLQPEDADFTITAKTEQTRPLPSIDTLRPSAEEAVIPTAISPELSALAGSAVSYLQAFSSLAAGSYAEAENGFNQFLNSYPDHQYSPNARYWLANAQLSQGKLQLASSNLRQLLVDREGQQRVPAALVLLARVYQQQNLPNEADEVLEQLRSRYPESSEAQQLFNNAEPQQQL
jgi:tol-pal system protein YbgF